MNSVRQTSSDESEQLGSEKHIAKTSIRESHVGFYLMGRFIAVYFTITMILTFFAESLLNTVRLNKGLSAEGLSWLSSNRTLEYFAKFYPDGNKPVVLISSDFVIVYLFAIAVYALVRFTYHKVVRDEGVDIHVGGLTWDALRRRGQNFWIRFFWRFSPNKGVHMKIFGLWLVYIFLYGIIASLAALMGVSVYLSPEIKLALYGSGIAFMFGTLDDLKFFKKIPPKEAIIGGLLTLGEGVIRRDFSGTIKKLSVIMENANKEGMEDLKVVLSAMLTTLKEQQEKKHGVALELQEPNAEKKV